MNNEDVRLNAANTLGIDTGATPRVAMLGYARRIKQFMDFADNTTEEGMNDFSRKVMDLYDAYAIMSQPYDKQMLASAKLAITDALHKKCKGALVIMMVCRNNTKDATSQALLKECAKLLKQVYTQYRALRGLGLYDLLALWGIVIYENMNGNVSPWVSLGVYGSMMVATMAMGGLMVSIDKKKAQMSQKLYDAQYHQLFKSK